MRLPSIELRLKIISAGVTYLPADQIFYKDFPYKVELSPKFKGLGGASGKKGCQIDISNPVKARQNLAKFNERMEKIISNVEYRLEIREFVALLDDAEYKTRMGGENSLFYFRDTNTVLTLVERYKDVINSVTGPINAEHENVFNKRNIIVREQLYYGRFRYMIQFDKSKEFVEGIANQLIETLDDMDPSTWRAHKLQTIINYVEYKNFQAKAHVKLGAPWATGSLILNKSPSHNLRVSTPLNFPPRSVIVYLTDPEDYVYIKIMTSEYIIESLEVKLFSELT
jgi:hypothetical protein